MERGFIPLILSLTLAAERDSLGGWMGILTAHPSWKQVASLGFDAGSAAARAGMSCLDEGGIDKQT